MDLNLRPAAYKAAAMPTELWGQSEGLSPSRLSELSSAPPGIPQALMVAGADLRLAWGVTMI